MSHRDPSPGRQEKEEKKALGLLRNKINQRIAKWQIRLVSW